MRKATRTPRRDWFETNLPAERPPDVHDLDWTVSSRFADGESQQRVAASLGVSRQMVTLRINRLRGPEGALASLDASSDADSLDDDSDTSLTALLDEAAHHAGSGSEYVVDAGTRPHGLG